MSRQEKIVKIVSEHKKIEVNELSKRLEVSKVTIRKDLDKLEARGIIHREHGYAVLNSEDDLNYRLAINYELKRKIAKEAAKEVEDNETVLIESGSTCALLAEELAFNRKNVTIITNSSFIAGYVRESESVNIILLGGEHQKKSQVNIGALTELAISQFFVDKLFIGIDGVDEKRGFTSVDLQRSQTARILAKQADNVIILTDSSKFDEKGTVTEFQFFEVTKVYTDSKIRMEDKNFLNQHHIQVITV
ncbi:MAG TPA: DeoR/GlpR family DNA-binding transcription regulator [Candidatus Atopostipes pullistercoris]|uniref:Lactose phosphotransferase system repressor n=1 Tax=Candidatus Atopostipes pullistercoris TaxID=2838467 RepID=A0A9D2G0Z4_9LACT|nr:DeoR/GlpR family DNA-binding transcription regulator [Candidatus Atopostipes pullistercoris]